MLDRVGRAIAWVSAWRKAMLGAATFTILVILAFLELDSAAKAPLFALVAATGLCISVSPGASKHPVVSILVPMLTGVASLMAAMSWVGGLDQSLSLWIWAMFAALIVIAVLGLMPDAEP